MNQEEGEYSDAEVSSKEFIFFFYCWYKVVYIYTVTDIWQKISYD